MMCIFQYATQASYRSGDCAVHVLLVTSKIALGHSQQQRSGRHSENLDPSLWTQLVKT